ncbi:MAG TPA: hypothetical protein VFA88_09890 [Gaiellaceae bacterium]|nr:hypothetical protein [Gaiellaceae bacterium]
MTTALLIDTELETTVESESDRILRWRSEELCRAGYDPRDALRLAYRKDVDLHLATSLLARGCPEETALLILL